MYSLCAPNRQNSIFCHTGLEEPTSRLLMWHAVCLMDKQDLQNNVYCLHAKYLQWSLTHTSNTNTKYTQTQRSNKARKHLVRWDFISNLDVKYLNNLMIINHTIWSRPMYNGKKCIVLTKWKTPWKRNRKASVYRVQEQQHYHFQSRYFLVNKKKDYSNIILQ